MSDKFAIFPDEASHPAREAFAITPHATNAISPLPKAIYVGGAGDIALRCVDSGADVTLVAVPVGTILPVRASHVRVTGTTATNLVGLA